MRIGCAVLLLLCAGGTRADAQAVATSFDQLAVLVKLGDKVSVVDASGREAKGRIGMLSRDAMILVTEAGPRKFGEVDVAAISQRRGDSLLNGAIIGAAAGTAYFVTLSMLLWDSDGGDVIVPTLIAGGVVMAGMGAAAGVGLDALSTRRQVIYQKPAGASRVSIVPLVGPGRRGAAVSVKF
jgi:hypothetical protein